MRLTNSRFHLAGRTLVRHGYRPGPASAPHWAPWVLSLCFNTVRDCTRSLDLKPSCARNHSHKIQAWATWGVNAMGFNKFPVIGVHLLVEYSEVGPESEYSRQVRWRKGASKFRAASSFICLQDLLSEKVHKSCNHRFRLFLSVGPSKQNKSMCEIIIVPQFQFPCRYKQQIISLWWFAMGSMQFIHSAPLRFYEQILCRWAAWFWCTSNLRD
jgi:hypothetical protein